MPIFKARFGHLHYELAGPVSGPVLVFSNSLGTDLRMWDAQISDFKHDFRVLRYNARGQWGSAVPQGPYSISLLAEDVIHLMVFLGIPQASLCGLSMGGMVGMALALRAPQRLTRLVLCNTSPKIGTPESWNARIDAVNQGGMKAVVDAILERWYTQAFRAAGHPAVEATRQMLLESPAAGYVACCAAVRDMDQREAISGIRVPTLIVSGAWDPVTPPAEGRFVAQQIAGAESVELPAAHLSNVEAAAQFNEAVGRFLRA